MLYVFTHFIYKKTHLVLLPCWYYNIHAIALLVLQHTCYCIAGITTCMLLHRWYYNMHTIALLVLQHACYCIAGITTCILLHCWYYNMHAIALLVLQHACYCPADITTCMLFFSQTFCQPFVEYWCTWTKCAASWNERITLNISTFYNMYGISFTTFMLWFCCLLFYFSCLKGESYFAIVCII